MLSGNIGGPAGCALDWLAGRDAGSVADVDWVDLGPGVRTVEVVGATRAGGFVK